jgi:hypothetical protein
MAGWYRVTKTIKGHQYLYEQQTYRENGRVRTRNRYIGPVAAEGASSGGGAALFSVTTMLVLRGLGGFGEAMLKQFDLNRWIGDVTSQLGLTTNKSVTTTKHRRRKKILLGYRDGKKYFAIAKGSKYERQRTPPDETWVIFGE